MSIRKLIHKKIVKRFFEKGGKNFTSLKGLDISYLFYLYDKHVFSSVIKQKLQKTRSSIRFFSRRRYSGAAGIVGTIKDCEYYLDISPTILSYVCKNNGYPDRVSCLQLIVENQIIYLLILLWGFLEKYENSKGLFPSMLNLYFNHKICNEKLVQLDKEFPIRYLSPISSNQGFLSYTRYSCYLDSLLTILFLGSSSFYRKNIFDTDVHELEYRSDFVPIGRKGSEIVTKEQTRKLAFELQEAMLESYSSINSKETLYSTKIRKILLKIYPDMKKRQWLMYNVSSIYDLLTEIFPNLKIKGIPNRIISKNKPSVTRRKESISMFQFWDFMDSYQDVEENYSEILWEKIDFPILVFQNGGIPPLRNFGSIKPEFVAIPGNETNFIIKKRAFGETILNSYQLFGVIVLHGTVPGEEGGKHYTSYFKAKNGSWYYYDDLNFIYERLNKLPYDKVFRETGGVKPEMYFYRKI